MMDKQGIREHYKKRLTEICDQDIKKGQVVLIGDCVIEYLDCNKYLPEFEVYNNGISGDTTELLFNSLYKRAVKFKPSKLFISIGSNDFGFEGSGVKETYNKIIDIVSEVKKRSKDTEIFLLSVLPVNPAHMDFINREYVDSRDNYEINMLNYYLKNYARKNQINFVDAKKALSTSFDQLNLNYTFDGFHLNESGYDVFSKLIKQYI
jgi:lysophospholipase L1-like esterase